MSQPPVKWGDAHRFFARRDYTIYFSGGDAIIVEPKTQDRPRSRRTVRIGPKYCNHRGAELLPAHLSAFKRVFDVSRQDILAD